MSLLKKIGLAVAVCQKCGFKTSEDYAELTHTLKHAIEDLDCKEETKSIIGIIDRDFEFGNTDDAERVINEIFEIMHENKKITIKNPFIITRG